MPEGSDYTVATQPQDKQVIKNPFVFVNLLTKQKLAKIKYKTRSF